MRSHLILNFSNQYYIHHTQLSGSSVCLADYCPVFGCCMDSKGGSNRNINSRYSPSSSGSSKNAFHNLIQCTTDEVERSRYKCESIANKCFDNEEIRHRFTSKVCDSLRCDYGMLKGLTSSSSTDRNSDTGDLTLVWGILKGIFISVILLFVIFYGLSTGVFFGSGKTKKKKH